DLGFHISISGIVTFKNAATVRDVATRVPLDRLLVETDSPYLAPVPNRGKTNEPAWVAHVAAAVAQLRGITLEELAHATTANYYRLFGRPSRPSTGGIRLRRRLSRPHPPGRRPAATVRKAGATPRTAARDTTDPTSTLRHDFGACWTG